MMLFTETSGVCDSTDWFGVAIKEGLMIPNGMQSTGNALYGA